MRKWSCSFEYSSCLGSHTCSFTLDLPVYSTAEIMFERLNYAISTCTNIDGDGTIVLLNGLDSDNDSDSDDD